MATAALAGLSLFLFLCRVISGTNSANISKPNGKAQVLAGTIAQAGEVFSETHVRGSGVTVSGYGASSVSSESVNRREAWVTTTDGRDIQIMLPAEAGVRVGHRVMLSYYKNRLLRLINLDTDETHELDDTAAKTTAQVLTFFGMMILLMGGLTIMEGRLSGEGMVIFGTLQLGWLAVFAFHRADRRVRDDLQMITSDMLAASVEAPLSGNEPVGVVTHSQGYRQGHSRRI